MKPYEIQYKLDRRASRKSQKSLPKNNSSNILGNKH